MDEFENLESTIEEHYSTDGSLTPSLVLFVDDQPEAPQFLMKLAKNMGYTVLLVESHEAAAQYIQDGLRPEYAILDIEAPFDARAGIEVARELRDISPDTRSLGWTGNYVGELKEDLERFATGDDSLFYSVGAKPEYGRVILNELRMHAPLNSSSPSTESIEPVLLQPLPTIPVTLTLMPYEA